MATDCQACDGFGWMPEGSGPGWYARDWRVLLDPAVRWVRCGQCGSQQAPLVRLHDQVARVALRKVEDAVTAWTEVGGWRRGQTRDGQVVYRWRDVACLPPGPMLAPHAFALISPMGVQRELGASVCRDHLRRLGAPALP